MKIRTKLASVVLSSMIVFGAGGALSQVGYLTNSGIVHADTVAQEKHDVSVKLLKEYSDKESMGNDSIVKVAPLVINPDGSGYIDLTFKGIFHLGSYGNVSRLIIYPSINDANNNSNGVEAKVVEGRDSKKTTFRVELKNARKLYNDIDNNNSNFIVSGFVVKAMQIFLHNHCIQIGRIMVYK